MDTHDLTRRLRAAADELGFDYCRIVPVQPAPHAQFLEEWLAAGRYAGMGYLARHADKRRDPARLAESDAGPFRSLIVLGVNYHQFDLPPEIAGDPSRGLIAAYAWGDDYHEIIRPLLFELDAALRRWSGRATLGKCLVDTGPVLERDWAHAAGLGFMGKNGCIIHPVDGSWLLLATILVPETLGYDAPVTTAADPKAAHVLAGLEWAGDYGRWSIALAAGAAALGTCGRCTRCLDACPTGAFVGPYHLDAAKCISYWTIETRDPIPVSLRPRFGNRIFGCDECQVVCPWNQRLAARTPRLPGLAARADRLAIPLLAGFAPATPYWLDAAAFAERFRRSPVRRAKRSGMARNVCVALGNWGDPVALDALALALADAEACVRGHAAWALGQVARRHGGPRALTLLDAARPAETDAWVLAEIAAARGEGDA
jgi:epoxyqueuosine reductase